MDKYNELNSFKEVESIEKSNQDDALEMLMNPDLIKGKAGLVKKVITNSKGHKQTVWVKAGEKQKETETTKESAPKDEKNMTHQEHYAESKKFSKMSKQASSERKHLTAANHKKEAQRHFDEATLKEQAMPGSEKYVEPKMSKIKMSKEIMDGMKFLGIPSEKFSELKEEKGGTKQLHDYIASELSGEKKESETGKPKVNR